MIEYKLMLFCFIMHIYILMYLCQIAFSQKLDEWLPSVFSPEP